MFFLRCNHFVRVQLYKLIMPTGGICPVPVASKLCESLGLSSSLPSDFWILISLRFICYIVSDDIHTVVFKTTIPCDYQLKTMPTWQCIPKSVLAYSHWCFNLRHCCKPFKSTIHVLQTEFLLLLKLLSCQKGIRHLLVTHV